VEFRYLQAIHPVVLLAPGMEPALEAYKATLQKELNDAKNTA
jgi:hypothetical protein